MPLIAPKPKRILPPEGTHIGRCVRILHLGTIPEEYMGEVREMNKIDLTFELVDESYVFREGEDAKPFVVSKEYTFSMGEKANLRKLVEGIIGTKVDTEEGFDVETLLGKACLITIQHKVSKAGNPRAEIVSASPLMKGQTAKEPFNVPKLLTYEKWDEAYFESLPEFIKDKITSSKEYKELRKTVKPDEYPTGPNPDDIPF